MSRREMEQFPRFRLMARIEHIILLVSFTVLLITGVPQRYATLPIAQGAIDFMGGIETVRVIHRAAAFLLVLGTAYHLFVSAYRWFVRRERVRIMPERKDVTDWWQTVLHNLGIINEPPKMKKFNWGEKFEYWAVVWGTAVMVVTGFILWNPISAAHVFPGQIIPIAKTAHSAEAILAGLSIIIWHLYNVLVKHRNWSMFSGKLSRDIMEEEHALELERIDAGGELWPHEGGPIDPRRKRVFIIVGAFAGIIVLAVLIWAFTFEQTAITTLPPITPLP
ncbi:MAG: cytochrome b/b6 domain-containing protein [Anaerolineae bacterium]|nr:cytochrome b/b6 domain-containing protein [Anaerolineae bacterium]